MKTNSPNRVVRVKHFFSTEYADTDRQSLHEDIDG